MPDSSVALLFSAIAIFLAQGTVMAVDEFYFHLRRGLKPWEAWGHPADTVFFLSCFFLAWQFSPSETVIKVWFILALISSLIITKDEWIHKKECCATEQWLHALLFVLHPLSLWMCYQLWLSGSPDHREVLRLLSILIFAFLIYQIVFWQVLAHRLAKSKKFMLNN